MIIDACPNLTVLKINCDDVRSSKKLFEDAVSKCKKLVVFYFKLRRWNKESPSFRLQIYGMLQNLKRAHLKHLRQLFLPDCNISDYDVRLMIKNIPSLEIIVVHSGMFVSANVTQSTLNSFLKDSDVFYHFKEKRQGIVETEIF